MDLKNVKFAHTHVHTEFSLLDGAMKIDAMVDKLKTMGHTAIAVTEHGNMYSLIKVNKKCKEAGIKHIIGCEFYVAPNSMSDKSSKKGDSVYHHLIVLAKNKRGYEQLIGMCSLGFRDGFYYKPRIDEDLLFGMDGNNLIVTTACIGSRFGDMIMGGRDSECRDMIMKYQKRFGEDFFLEVQNHGLTHTFDGQLIDPEKLVSEYYEHYGRVMGIPIIATADTHYLNLEDAYAHDVALCIGTGQNLVDERKFKFEGSGYHLLNTEEMLSRFPVDYVTNTMLIADKCDDDILNFGRVRLPEFPVPEDKEFDNWLVNTK